MMLMLQKFDSDELELAFLTDESPFQRQRNLTADEPYKSEHSLLGDAAYTASFEGHAWFYVVYRSDSVYTWGSRQVNLMVGGTIRRRINTENGAWTGRYSHLRFEAIARPLFNLCIGSDSCAEFIVIMQVGVLYPEHQDDDASQAITEPAHPLLGDAVPRVDPRRRGPVRRTDKLPPFFPQPTGCVVLTINHAGHTEKCVIRDVPQFHQFRFMLTEFARRLLIRPILITLGFVRDNDVFPSQSSFLDFSPALAGQLQNAMSSIDALHQIVASDMVSTQGTIDSHETI